ncbi:MAG TPA: hypothetical protein VLK35_19425 [Methylomirabilota bacterium]|nr:hypothetical protein [Methylomirabilota bacterium]
MQIGMSPGGVPKLPVSSARVTALGLEGDAQRDREHHGGPDRALCLLLTADEALALIGAR